MTKRKMVAAGAGAALMLAAAATAVLGVQGQHATEHIGTMDSTNRTITRCKSAVADAMDIVNKEDSPRVVDGSGGTVKTVNSQELHARVDCVVSEPSDTTAQEAFILSAAVKDGAVHLVWTDDIPEDVTRIAPIRSDTGEPNTFENLLTSGMPVTARSFTDTTVIAGETYWYRLRWRHGSGSAAAYSVTRIVRATIPAHATPEPPDTSTPPVTVAEAPDTTDPGAGHTGNPSDPVPLHEPSGMTLIGAFDGSVKESGGHAFGIGGFGPWNSNHAVEVVDDVTNPAGSGKSLRFTWRTKVHPRAGIARTPGGLPGGPYQEVYVRWRVILEPGGWNFGHKFFYLARSASLARDNSITDRPSGGTSGAIRYLGGGVAAYSNDPSHGSTGVNPYPIKVGQWITLELHVRRETPGLSDGFVRMWADGVLVAEEVNTAFSWPAGNFDYFEWYGNANSVPTESYYRLGELYISGKPQ